MVEGNEGETGVRVGDEKRGGKGERDEKKGD